MKRIVFFLIMFNILSLNADINFAKKLFNDGLIEESRNEFEKIINESPASSEAAEANYYIAMGYIQQKDFKTAVSYFNKILTGYKNYNKYDLILFEMGKAYLKLQKYDSAVQIFNELFKRFPTSENMKKSLKYFADALYLSKDYNFAIITLDKLIKNYSQSNSIPYLYLTLAKAYYKDNIIPKSKEIAQKIIKKYPNSNERWETEKLLFEIEKPNLKNYIIKLEKLLSQKMPRKYDEEFTYILSTKYLQTKDYQKAIQKLKYLLKKYENSQNLCIYLNKLMNANLILEKAKENIRLYKNNEKKIPDNLCKTKAKYLLAKSLLTIKNYSETDFVINDLLKTTKNDSLILDILLLKSKLFVSTNRFVPAIKNYLNCLEKYSKSGKSNFIYFQIGQIYKNHLSNYTKAIDYYSKVSPYSKYYFSSLKQISNCYEITGNFQKAFDTLNEIDIQAIKNESERNKIKNKLKYLKNFKLTNYHKAFENLLTAMIKYKDNQTTLERELLSIFSDDLKMYDKALELLQNSSDYYQKCKIILKLWEKSKYEGNDVKKYDKMLVENLNHLKDKPELYNEILLEKMILTSLDEKTINKIKDYIKKYPTSSANEKFKIYISEFYLNKNQIDLAKDYILSLNPTKKDFTYYKLKIALAEMYYKENKDSLAYKLYNEASDKINLANPMIMFHYCVTMYQNNHKEAAIKKLEFLVNNTDFFKNKQNIYIFLSKVLSENQDYNSAISYLKNIPEKFRDDNYYNLLAGLYEKIQDFENAKLAIMHIKNKDSALLSKLADLQILTNDKEMAIYTLETLIKKGRKNSEFYKKIGELYFELKNYKKAAEYLQKYTQNLPMDKVDKNSALHLIISFLKLKNRPKADKTKKLYKKLFSEYEKNILALNYGIYYLDIDLNTSIKKFKSIIKSKKSNENIKYEAYFWRGVAYLKQKKTDLALADFLKAKNTNDKKLLYNVHLKLGTIYFSKEEYNKALQHYSFVINNAEKEKIAYDAAKNFAMVCKTTKEWDKAIETYNIILERWGNDRKIKAETIFDIGFSYFRDKKFAKAINYFTEAIPLFDDSDIKAEAQYWIGESYFGMENYEQAVTEFLKVYYNYPSQIRWAASAQLKTAECYIKLNRINKAKKVLENVMTKYGKSSQWGKQAENLLQKI